MLMRTCVLNVWVKWDFYNIRTTIQSVKLKLEK